MQKELKRLDDDGYDSTQLVSSACILMIIFSQLKMPERVQKSQLVLVCLDTSGCLIGKSA
jgi:hypothetical protein